jgi:hypothetical protein
MKICKNCKHLNISEYGAAICVSPKNGVNLVTGKIQTRDARLNRENLQIIGCGHAGNFFEPLFEMDDDEHIASVFCRGGA